MADPICRWRNATPELVQTLVRALPHKKMTKSDFREKMEKNWDDDFFHTSYQLACQLGLYYESKDSYTPRFYDEISLEDAELYLQNWIQKYYVPNPYTKKGFAKLDRPVYIIDESIKYLEAAEKEVTIAELIEHLFKEDIGNKDILVNAINKYSNVISINKDIVSLLPNYKQIRSMYIDRNDKQGFFDNFEIKESIEDKLHIANAKLYFTKYLKNKGLVINTIGGYTSVLSRKTYIDEINRATELSISSIYEFTNIQAKNQILEFSNIPAIKTLNDKDHNLFSSAITQYVEFLSTLKNETDTYSNIIGYNKIYFGAPGTGKSYTIKDKDTKGSKNKTVVTFHPDSDYASFVGSYKPVVAEDGKTIIYSFAAQAFTKAYINAWKDRSQRYFLVIEEINRGNCAQIFGDLFQLLDRDKYGFSEYAIDIDLDFAKYLKFEFEKTADKGASYREILSTIINDGDLDDDFDYSKIALPNNLTILATMNTSDQSLFPMDSAFKRRWIWKYIPINYAEAEKIEIRLGDNIYNWGKFIKEANTRIKDVCNSEDKQLGTFFVKADQYDESRPNDNSDNNQISFELFRSKVMSYLWFEIFKDEFETERNMFRIPKADSKVDDKMETEEFSFGSLFSESDEADTIMLQNFMRYMKIKATPNNTGADTDTATEVIESSINEE